MFNIIKNETKFKEKDNILIQYKNKNNALNLIGSEDYFSEFDYIIVDTNKIKNFKIQNYIELKEILNFNDKRIIFIDKLKIIDEYGNTKCNKFFEKISRLIIKEI